MPELISRHQADAVLARMGYDIIAEEDGLVAYLDRTYPGDPVHPLLLDFANNLTTWDDCATQLENDGANVAVFIAELEAL